MGSNSFYFKSSYVQLIAFNVNYIFMFEKKKKKKTQFTLIDGA